MNRTINDIWGINGAIEKRGLFLSWHMTHWCNYRCSYCFQKKHERGHLSLLSSLLKGSLEIKKRVLMGKLPANHAFDNFSVEEWLKAFDKFQSYNCSLLLDGGEVFLDYKNTVDFIKKLIAKDFIKTLSIITNASVPIKDEDINVFVSPKIWFVLSYHPENNTLEKFYQRVVKLKESGFNIVLINFVFNPEKMELFAEAVEKFKELGIKINPNPDHSYAKQLENNPLKLESLNLLKDYVDEFDLNYKLGITASRGKFCCAPMLNATMTPEGELVSTCFPSGKRLNLFGKNCDLREILTAEPVPCPMETCYCLHQYPFLCDSDGRYLDTFNIFKRYAEVALLR